MVSPSIERIVWCYGVYLDFFDKQKNIEFHEGIPSEEMFDGKSRTLLILDDLMSQADDRVENIFTKLSHHKSVSFISNSKLIFQKQTNQNNKPQFTLH